MAMQQFQGTTAVITGAGSGIGRALCTVFAEEGARIVAADVEETALAETVSGLRAQGATAIGHPTNVADAAAVERLADRAYEAYGAVHVLCNNAGVFAGGCIWDTTDADWDWILGVNVRGIVNGVRAFVPRMLAQETEGHVLNVASMAGLVSAPITAPYCASKAAAVAISECLAYDLEQTGSRIGCSVIVPGAVATNIATSDRNRPEGPRPDLPPSAQAVGQALAQFTAVGKEPLTAARRIVAGLKAGWFYLPTNDSYEDQVRVVGTARLEKRLPPFQMFD